MIREVRSGRLVYVALVTLALVLCPPSGRAFPNGAFGQGGQSRGDKLARGKALFLEGRLEDAARSLRESISEVTETEDRIEARLTLALIAQAQGNDERTLVELQWALTDDAGLALDPEVYSPKMQTLVAQAREVRFDRLLSAKRLFAAGSLEPALEEFELAAALMETSQESANLDNTLDALLSAALINQTLGREDRAQAAFVRCIRLRPSLELDPEYYSPSTVALFRNVKGQAPEKLNRARTALQAGDAGKGLALLDELDPALLDKTQRIELKMLRAFASHLKDERDRASELLNEVIRARPTLSLDASFYGESFLELAEKLRLVATRGLPRIAIVQSTDAVVHRLSRQGFEEATLAQYTVIVLPGQAEELRAQRDGFDLIYALGQDAESLASDCCPDVPVIVGNISRVNEGNSTSKGTILWTASFSGQVQVAMRALPNVSRVGVVHGPDRGQDLTRQLQAELAPLGVQLASRQVDSADNVSSAATDLLRSVDLFWYLPDPTLASVTTFQQVLEKCNSARKPIFAFHESLVQAGAFVGVSADFEALGHQAGRMAVRYLSSRDASVLAVEPGVASQIVLNVSAAERLGIAPDPGIVSLAGTVFRN